MRHRSVFKIVTAAAALDSGTLSPLLKRLEAALRADPRHEIKAVLMVHADTASSARNDLPAFRRALDAAGRIEAAAPRGLAKPAHLRQFRKGCRRKRRWLQVQRSPSAAGCGLIVAAGSVVGT